MSCERKLDPHIQAAPKCLTKYDTDHFVHVLQEAYSLDNVHVRRRMKAAPILRYGRGVALDGRRRWSGLQKTMEWLAETLDSFPGHMLILTRSPFIKA